MNQVDAFELERISQAITDIRSCMMTDVFIPEKIKYCEGQERPEDPEQMEDFYPMDKWGGFDRYGWFRYGFTVPEVMEGKKLWVEIAQDKRDWYAQNPQFLLYCNGAPLQGMDIYHEECLLREKVHAGETVDLEIQAWSGMSIRDRSWSDKENRPGMFAIRLYCTEPIVEELYYDLKTAYEVVKYADQESEAGRKIISVLNQAINEVDLRCPGSTENLESMAKARKIIREGLYEKEESGDGMAYSVGHTHIDVAWMWQFSHTKMKTQRSFRTVLKLMEEYPEYRFMSSQPQLYEYMEEAQPEQFEKIRRYIEQGRWEAEGGMWIEADCNLTSGESLIRQFLEGKAYFREKFGKENVILWLPDVFGYSAALPQICKKSGIQYFMTTKISWNELDKIPYDTFMWKGIDGTEILTHFAPAKQYDTVNYNPFGFARSPHITTYNGVLEPDYVMGGWKRYSQKSLNQEFLIPFGYGDGGGGTTREMIEKGIRMEKGIPGCPRVKFSTSREFFEDLEKSVQGQKHLPVWNGELYLEFHRGTYTSVAMVKRMNRQMENLLQRAEFMMTAAQSICEDYIWDKAEWKKALHQFLTNQFHDILPGSAITAVYDDVKEIYRQVEKVFQNNKENAVQILAETVPQNQLAVVNTLGFDRNGQVEFEYESQAEVIQMQNASGENWYAQKTGENHYLAHVHAKAGSISAYDIKESSVSGKECWNWDGITLETSCLRVVFDQDGTIASIYDKEEEREVLSGNGNVLETFEDRPYQYDAWELSPYYREKEYVCRELEEMTVTEMGPVRMCIRQVRRYLSSRICQDIYFYPDSKRIDFHTTIDWKEEHVLLKVLFPVDVLADQAVYEIQFGTVQRPTHTNTSWDAERFETCAQRFADLAEPDYGAALMNDCKYGYDIHDGEMRLTLLRSPSFPNTVDQGYHEFTYSFMPHRGDYRKAQIQKEAYSLNQPLISFLGTGLEDAECVYQPLLICNHPGIFTETIKPAEDGNGFIVRCYEGFGCRQRAQMTAAAGWNVRECSMMEEEIEVEENRDTFVMSFMPFEIKTLRITK